MIAFGFACWAAGDILRQGLFGARSHLSPVLRHNLSFAAGNVAFSYLLTFFGFAGLFLPGVFWVLLLGGIGIGVWRILTKSQNGWVDASEGGIDGPGETAPVSGACLFLVVAAGLFVLPAILQAAAPPYVRDSLVYHLLCPKEYLKAGGLVHVEGNLYSAFPKGHEVLMTLLMAVGGDRAAQGFSVLQHVAAVTAIYSLSRMAAGPWAAAISAVGLATVPPAVYFAGCGYVEPALMMTLGASLLALTLLSRPPPGVFLSEKGGILFVGLLAGWMPALKYTGLIYLGLIGLIFLWGQRKAPTQRVLTSAGLLTLGALPGLCWMLWNWLTLGNPVYPFAWFLFGGLDWDETRTRAMNLYFDFFGMGSGFLDYLLLPWRLAFAGRFDSIQFDGALGPFLFIFFIGAMMAAVNSTCRLQMEKGPRGMGFALLVSAAFFVFGTQQARFWLPTQMIAGIYAAPAIDLLLGRAKEKRVVKGALVLTLAVSLLWNGWFLGSQFLKIGYYRSVLGWEQESAFLGRRVPGYPAIEFVNHHLPGSSRILCVWTGAYGYYLDRPYFSDTLLEDVTLKKFIDASNHGEDLFQRLQQSGFSHVFMQISLSERNMEPRQKEIFRDFLSKKAAPLFRFKDYIVVAVGQN